MDVQGERFVLDCLSTYYFYEVEDFKGMRDDTDTVLAKIKEYSRYEEGDHTYTISKYGSVSKGYTQRGIEIVNPTEGDSVWIGGEKRKLDLKYKMEFRELEDHMRIATRIIEDGHSVSCIMYIDHA